MSNENVVNCAGYDDATKSRDVQGGVSVGISIDRPTLTDSQLELVLREEDKIIDGDDDAEAKVACEFPLKKQMCGRERLKEVMTGSFPIVGYMREYKWRQWLLNDVMAGISVGFLHLPQGLGFALLAGVPAVLGLYSSIIPVWLYFVFGSSRHISVGTMAVTALLVGSYVNKFEYGVDRELPLGAGAHNSSGGNFSGDNHIIANDDKRLEQDHQRMNAASLITLTVGCLQLLMWGARMGIMSSYMSRPFVKSFITGAVVHIIANQLPFQLGYQVKKSSGSFQLPINFYRIMSNISETNVASLVTSIICMAFLLSIKYFSTREVAKKLKFPIPGELITVLAGTLVSYVVGFEGRFDVKIIGIIPEGLPKPHLPSLSLLPSKADSSMLLIIDLLVQALPIAIVCYALNITMAKLMSDKYDYSVDSNQEMLAIGIANTVSPFFGCFVACQAHSRTLVNESCAGKSPLSSFISTLVPLLVISGTGFLFATLPICVLGSVVSASLTPLLISESIEFVALWRVCRRDCVVWVFCFLSTVFINVDVGLVVGIVGSGIAILVETRRGRLMLMRNVTNTELFVEEGFVGAGGFVKGRSAPRTVLKKNKTSTTTTSKINKPVSKNTDGKPINNNNNKNNNQMFEKYNIDKDTAIFRLHGSIIFSNCDTFKEQLLQSIQFTLLSQPKFANKLQISQLLPEPLILSSASPLSSSPLSSSASPEVKQQGEPNRKHAILDFSRVSDIDATGLNIFKNCVRKINNMGVDLSLCCCSRKVKRKLSAGDLFLGQGQDQSQGQSQGQHPHHCQLKLYPSVIDAVLAISCHISNNNSNNNNNHNNNNNNNNINNNNYYNSNNVI
ncbi:hypothetical protein HELRODRAFT_194468 [Helobdella robusta]|uniref:STAS domain-containing protein n=1 Tax=Helobdella robusta TaxID=6412 RepID=T1FW32_HELRO|nr:hypothetical protein HELRODRAFT_194468 [Helobdella robusta]ESN91990.1 hypothetical protein HELRODRAFT_194468 [Helobdella robusta]